MKKGSSLLLKYAIPRVWYTLSFTLHKFHLSNHTSSEIFTIPISLCFLLLFSSIMASLWVLLSLIILYLPIAHFMLSFFFNKIPFQLKTCTIYLRNFHCHLLFGSSFLDSSHLTFLSSYSYGIWVFPFYFKE